MCCDFQFPEAVESAGDLVNSPSAHGKGCREREVCPVVVPVWHGVAMFYVLVVVGVAAVSAVLAAAAFVGFRA